jgi:hypothetical protein
MNMNIKRNLIHICAVFLMLFAFRAPATVLYVDLNCTNATPPYADWNTAATDIQSAVDVSTNGDLILVTNGIYATGGRVVNDGIGGILTNRVAMTKPVTLQSINGPAVTVIQGYQIPGTTNGDTAVRCVYMADGAVLIGFTVTNGATQATSRGDTDGGGIFCWYSGHAIVSNCVLIANSSGYGYGGGIEGGTLYNCQLIGNHTITRGGAASDSILNNCILTNNHAFYGFGGGTYECKLNNCLLTGNSVDSPDFGGQSGGADNSVLTNCTLIGNSGYWGGGTGESTLYNCLIVSNSAAYGGGAGGCNLENCTIVGNTASISGGGAYQSVADNSIIYYNTAPVGANYYGSPCGSLNTCGSINFSCTTPYPGTVSGDGVATAIGDFTNAPLFVGTNNFHLQTNSPCINAGNNSVFVTSNDLDGNPRIVGGTVDIGAYEYQTPSSILSYVWAQKYGLPTDGTADYADSDGDGMNNWQEWKSGTIPTNAASVLAMASPAVTVTNATVTWKSVTNVIYFLQRSSDLSAQPAFVSIHSNLVGQAGTTSYTDTTATNGGSHFYRVGVQ